MSISTNHPYFWVIMPLKSDSLAEQKKQIIAAEAQKRGLAPHFPSYNKDAPAFDLNSMIVDLGEAEFVLVDLSLERPSCYYEVGVAEALGKEVYLLAKQGTDIHQTARRESVQFYGDLEHLKSLVASVFESAMTCKSPT